MVNQAESELEKQLKLTLSVVAQQRNMAMDQLASATAQIQYLQTILNDKQETSRKEQ